MALINCPECNREISSTVNHCPHCGYSLKKITVKAIAKIIRQKIYSFPDKTRISLLIISGLIIFVILLTIISNCFISTKERIAINACEAIVDCLENKDSFSIVDIYFNNTLQENKIVQTKYQVFVEFTYENAYGGVEKDRVLYILSPNGKEHLIESDDTYYAMYDIAEMEIYSIQYDVWKTYSESKIKKIERKIK